MKKAKIELTIEYTVEVPDDRDEDQVEFHRNESSRCSTNLLDELKEITQDGEACICDKCKFFCNGFE